jgi:hypothetical protein
MLHITINDYNILAVHVSWKFLFLSSMKADAPNWIWLGETLTIGRRLSS